MNSTTYATETATMAAATRPCSWRTRGGIGHVGGGSQLMCASDLQPVAFQTAPNAKRSPRRLAERLT
jgi:hypothetical protein